MNLWNWVHKLVYALGAFMAVMILIETCGRGFISKRYWLTAAVGMVELIVTALIAVLLILALVIPVINRFA